MLFSRDLTVYNIEEIITSAPFSGAGPNSEANARAHCKYRKTDVNEWNDDSDMHEHRIHIAYTPHAAQVSHWCVSHSHIDVRCVVCGVRCAAHEKSEVFLLLLSRRRSRRVACMRDNRITK